MKLKSKSSCTTTRNEYIITHNGFKYRYTEHLNKKGKLIDQELEFSDGSRVPFDREELMEEFSEFVETVIVQNNTEYFDRKSNIVP